MRMNPSRLYLGIVAVPPCKVPERSEIVSAVSSTPLWEGWKEGESGKERKTIRERARSCRAIHETEPSGAIAESLD